MHKYTIEDDFETTVERYWEMFFDEAYNTALFKHLKITRVVEEVTREGEGEELIMRRRLLLTPQREVPKLMKKIAKGAIQYREHNVFTQRTQTLTVRIEPSFMADKFVSTGRYLVSALDSTRVRRTFHGEISCRVPLLGGRIEKHIHGEVVDSYRATTEFTRAWLREHA
jgi:hypothetical protein